MRVVVVVVVVSAGDAHPRQRRPCVRACVRVQAPPDASGALSRVEGEMTAFQIRSALIRAGWGFDRHEMDAEDARTSLQMDLGDPGSYTLCSSTLKATPVPGNQLRLVRGWWRRAASRHPADADSWWCRWAPAGSTNTEHHGGWVLVVLQSCSEASALHSGADTLAGRHHVALVVTEHQT